MGKDNNRLDDVLNEALASVDHICIFPEAGFVRVGVVWPDGKTSDVDGNYEDIVSVIEAALYRTVDNDG